MTDSRAHVSESLPAFLEGTLDRHVLDQIEEHLALCDACRQEAHALKLLRTPAGDPMTPSERLALEHRVMAGIAADEPAATPIRPSPPGRARLAQALGVAAVIAAVGTFFYLGGMDGADMGGSDDAGVSSDTVDEEAGAPERAREGRTGRADSLSKASDAAGETSAGAGGAGTGGGAPSPRFSVARDPYTPAGLEKLGESGLDSVRFANYYSANDAGGRYTLLEQLVTAAERASGATVAAQVEECGSQVLDTQDPTIPTFGGIGELRGEEVVVLGFAWTRRATGSLDRYMVWAWERGSCDAAVDFVDGRIETAG